MIIRRQYTANFTTISNKLFDDDRLLADEMGILAYLLSRPDNWEVRRPALQRRFGIGPIAMKRVIRSWMCAGWCRATKIRLPSGKFAVLYDIVDLPGQEMTEEQAIEALSLVAGEAANEDSAVESEQDDQSTDAGSATVGQPTTGEPLVAEVGVAIYKDLTNTDLTNTDQQNSERELARAREKHALNLTEFKRRYPTAASDDQAKIDEEWFKIEFDEGDRAIEMIPAFLEKLKRDRRSHTPAAWKYLKDKRWTLLAEQAAAKAASSGCYAKDGREAKALGVLYAIAGKSEFLRMMTRPDGVRYSHLVTPRLLALADAPPPDEWPVASRQQAGAWEENLLKDALGALARRRLQEGDRIPWPWPPGKDGTIYAATTGPPSAPLHDEDLEHFR